MESSYDSQARRKSVEREASMTVADVFAHHSSSTDPNVHSRPRNGTPGSSAGGGTSGGAGGAGTAAASVSSSAGGGGGKPPKNSVAKRKSATYASQRTSSTLSSGSSGVPASPSSSAETENDRKTTISLNLPPSSPSSSSSSSPSPRIATTDHNNTPKKLHRQAASNITFASQHELPRLPIPSLEETLNKFLQHLAALQSSSSSSTTATNGSTNGGGENHDNDQEEEEDDDTQRARAQHSVLAFLKGDGPKLQELLVEYDRLGQENGTLGSYVEEFWNDSYLAPDSSVVLNLNPFFVLEDGPDPKTAKNPIRRAASLCFASLKMASQLRNEAVKPDVVRGRPLCMDQFKALFSAARVPSAYDKDSIALYDNCSHVVVQCRTQMYYFQGLWPNGTVAVDEGDLMDILGAIQSHATGTDDSTGASSRTALGVLTSLPRHEWGLARDQLIRHSPLNAESLRIVDSALFVMVLDDYIPLDVHDAAANMLHGSYEIETNPDDEYTDYQVGSCLNRWYDKLQIIVCGDGTAGINFEHSAIDGHTALRFVSDIYAETVISFAQSITKLVQAHDNMIPNVIEATVQRAAVTLDQDGRTTLDVFPKKIPFDIPPEVKEKIYYAETALGDEIVASETHVLEFARYGKLFICENKLSPDSYVQMSMMLAYYKLYGKVVCAYEPVLTKGFYHGRTEAMRPATLEAKQLCEIWCKPSATPSQKEYALRHATQVHSQYVKECARGKGVDRHLFALKCIAEKNGLPVPAFFQQEPWKMLNHTILSTSNCGNPSLRLFGFGPVVPDGLGIGYIIKDHGIQYSVSSKHRQTKRYVHTLDCILKEMGQLFKPSSNMQVPPSSSGGSTTSSSRAGTVSSSAAAARRASDEETSRSGRRVKAMIPVDHMEHDSYGDVWGELTPTVPPAISATNTTPSGAATYSSSTNGNDNNRRGSWNKPPPRRTPATTEQPVQMIAVLGGDSTYSQFSGADSATVSVSAGEVSDDGDDSVDFDHSSAVLIIPSSLARGVSAPATSYSGQRIEVPKSSPPVPTAVVDSFPPPPAPSPQPIGTPRSAVSSRWDPETDLMAPGINVAPGGGISAGGGGSGGGGGINTVNNINVHATGTPSDAKNSLLDDSDSDDDDEEIVVPITPIDVEKPTTKKDDEVSTLPASPPKLTRQKSNDSMPKVPARRGSMFIGVKEPSMEYKELAQKGINLHMAGNRLEPLPLTAVAVVHKPEAGSAPTTTPPPPTTIGATTFIPFVGSNHSNYSSTSINTATTSSDITNNDNPAAAVSNLDALKKQE
jgi:carnitine O-acetyltransferase